MPSRLRRSAGRPLLFPERKSANETLTLHGRLFIVFFVMFSNCNYSVVDDRHIFDIRKSNLLNSIEYHILPSWSLTLLTDLP